MIVKSVLIAVKNNQQSTKLKKILISHGYQIASIVDDAYSALRILRSQQITISILDYDLSGLNGLQLAQIIADEKLGPVILLSQSFINTGSKPPASLFGILLKPVTEYQLINTLNLAMVQYENKISLENELAEVKDALESRKIIEKAKGILMKKHGFSEEMAYNKLRKSSMEKRIPMKKIAEAIILMDEF